MVFRQLDSGRRMGRRVRVNAARLQVDGHNGIEPSIRQVYVQQFPLRNL